MFCSKTSRSSQRLSKHMLPVTLTACILSCRLHDNFSVSYGNTVVNHMLSCIFFKESSTQDMICTWEFCQYCFDHSLFLVGAYDEFCQVHLQFQSLVMENVAVCFVLTGIMNEHWTDKYKWDICLVDCFCPLLKTGDHRVHLAQIKSLHPVPSTRNNTLMSSICSQYLVGL